MTPENKLKKQIVITGTGRAGTTFIVELLSYLGLDTGFSTHEIESYKDKVSNAGLEHKVGEKSSPYIVKDPSFSDYVNDVLMRNDVCIEHVFIPIRDIESVAASRRINQKTHFDKFSIREKWHFLRNRYLLYGGLLYTTSSKKGVQEAILMEKLFELLLSLSKHEIPVTFIQFPHFISQPEYLYKKLAPVLKNISYKVYLKTFEALADPEKPRNFTSKLKSSK